MPYNPAGLFSLVASYLAQPGTEIRTEQHNPVFEDVGSALSSVLLRDGRAPMTGPLNMNGQPINNVPAGNSPSSVATLAQAMPIGAIIDFAGDAVPAGWMLPYGQAISRTVYATLFAIIGTKYGTGDGSTTFNLPKLNGRITAGRDDMGGTAANLITTAGSGIDGKTIGAVGGAETVTIAQNQLPNVALSLTAGGTTSADMLRNIGTQTASAVISGGTAVSPTAYSPGAGSVSVTGTTSSINGGVTQVATNKMPPAFITNKIIRVSYDG